MAKAVPTTAEVSSALGKLVSTFAWTSAKHEKSITARVQAGLSKEVKTASGLFLSSAGSLNAYIRDNSNMDENDQTLAEFFCQAFATLALFAKHIEGQVPEAPQAPEVEQAPARPRATKRKKAEVIATPEAPDNDEAEYAFDSIARKLTPDVLRFLEGVLTTDKHRIR